MPTLPPPIPPRPRLRILCLHGFGGSARAFYPKLGPLASLLAPIADLVLVDSPSPEGWWIPPRVPEGFERSRAYLTTVFAQQGPFDGVLGFSQGAVFTSLLVGLNGTQPFRFSFAIMIAGFAARNPRLASLYIDRARYALPSLHIYGRGDANVAPDESARLAQRFGNPTVVVHA